LTNNVFVLPGSYREASPGAKEKNILPKQGKEAQNDANFWRRVWRPKGTRGGGGTRPKIIVRGKEVAVVAEIETRRKSVEDVVNRDKRACPLFDHKS